MKPNLLKLRDASLGASTCVILGSNIINYFWYYKHLNDRELQWDFAMKSIALSLLLMSLYMWITEHLKRSELGIVLTGWVTIFLLVNFVGVIIGYNLHTIGFMIIMYIAAFFGAIHFGIKLYQRIKKYI